MGRLIDADELLDWIQNCWDWATVDGITSTTVLKQTMTDISQLPTVEAIPKDQYEARLKADLKAILVELQVEIEELEPLCNECDYAIYDCTSKAKVNNVIQQKINELKAEQEGKE